MCIRDSNWDEGPEIGGEYGPYFQSQRLHLYEEKAQELIDKGVAYLCYCTPEELEAQREEARRQGRAPGYTGRCRNLTEKDRVRLEMCIRDRFYTCPEPVLKVPPAAFFPRPKVWSAAIRLRFRPQSAVPVEDEQFFFQVVRASFSHRRKTLANSLQHDSGIGLTKECIAAALESAAIDPQRRGETLSLEEFALLAKALAEHMG